jgi:hypothetical protein
MARRHRDDGRDRLVVADLGKWFYRGQVTPNGAVRPPDGSTFPGNNTTCTFYQWGAQMFLWLTSEEGGRLIMDGPQLFNVLPSDDGKRTMVQNGYGPQMVEVRAGKGEEVGELAQAGSAGVLMSQAKSLVYYGIAVNNVYAYFTSGYKAATGGDGLKAMKDFPNTGQQALDVVQYAVQTFPRPDVFEAQDLLSMEMKSSWVDASTVDASKYVTIDAVVPNYTANAGNTVMTVDPTNPTIPMKLALTGIHVVGTVQNHPEFVWATFEHVDNAPDADFYYNTAVSQQPLLKAYSTSGNYTFRASGVALSDANTECAIQVQSYQVGKPGFEGLKAGDIVAVDSNQKPVTAGGQPACRGGIVPSDTVRARPWGSKSSADNAGNNTELIAINNSVLGQLAPGDIRKNYVQIGAIWTSQPQGAPKAPIPYQGDTTKADLRGSLNLYNSTMETYTYPDSFAPNCFSCHQLSKDAKNSFGAFGLSHIFSELQPLQGTP